MRVMPRRNISEHYLFLSRWSVVCTVRQNAGFEAIILYLFETIMFMEAITSMDKHKSAEGV